MVLDVMEKRLIILFVEGLGDSLKGLVRAFELGSLHEAIRRALSLEDSVAKGKLNHKPSPIVQQKKYLQRNFPPPKVLPLRPNKNEETKNEL